MVDTWGSKLNEFMQIVINKQFTKPIGRAWLIRERIVNEVPLRTIPDVIWYFSDNSIKDYIEFIDEDDETNKDVRWISPQKKKEFINLFK
jgi:hypothetical protein